MKVKQMKSFVSYFFLNFFLLVFLTLFIQENRATDLLIFTEKISLFIYLFLFALVYSSLVLIYVKIKEKRKMKKIEVAVQMLNEGHYSANVFLKMFSKETPIQITEEIDREFLKLQEKMLLISEEAVSATQQPSHLTKETREEIIESERKRIARELHDSVSQQLFAAAMLLSTIEKDDEVLPKAVQKQLILIHSIIAEAQSEMRALLLHLRPVKLDGKSLKKGIEDLLKELESKLPINITHEIEDIALTEGVENHLFRVTQELLSNVLRHSEAKELEVYLKETKYFYRLRFVDDGKGFDLEAKKDSGLGLMNIRERIERMGGKFQVVSFPNQGASVEVQIPLITGRAK